jgi:transposase-like protein
VGVRSAHGIAPLRAHLRGMRNAQFSVAHAPNAAEPLIDAVLARGLACPHCGEVRVHRWGTFRQRQRWRCTRCRRTFNALSGTPLAGTKRLDAWAAYAQSLMRGQSVRRAAKSSGVHRNTAFRWRHLLLTSLRERSPGSPTGVIELHETFFPYSEKGSRKIEHAALPGGIFYFAAHYGRVSVVIARDRYGCTIARALPIPLSMVPQLETSMSTSLRRATSLISMRGRYSAHAQFARRAGLHFGDGRANQCISAPVPPLNHVRNATAAAARLHDWMRRFRGVATKYLPNYLAWHEVVDTSHRNAVEVIVAPAFARERAAGGGAGCGSTPSGDGDVRRPITIPLPDRGYRAQPP